MCGTTTAALPLQALGYGNIELSFLTLRDSVITSIEPPSLDTVPSAGAAFTADESDIIDSRIKYFGDVTGNFGQQYGLTQNGSRAIGSGFTVEVKSIQGCDSCHPC